MLVDVHPKDFGEEMWVVLSRSMRFVVPITVFSASCSEE